jgi:S1-C subfamily serine protease
MRPWRIVLQRGALLYVALSAIPAFAGSDDYDHLLSQPLSSPANAQLVPSKAVDAQIAQSADAALGSTSQLDSYWSGLRNLPKGGSPHLRGAREVAVYAQVSPSVVLVLSGDSLGSGTLLDQSGLIVTNYHVVEGSKDVGVIFKPVVEGERPTKAQVVAGVVIRVDQVSDLALIRVQEVPSQARPAHLASISSLQVGDDVHAIGHPTGEAWTYTRGIVSQIRRNYEWHAEDNLPHRADVIQTQTPINPGNSGGPLINNDGDVIGVNSFKGEGEGLNFAVSADAVQNLLAAKDDRVARPIKPEASNADCEPKVLKTWRVSDPPGTDAFVDVDCDGDGDVIVQTPDEESKPMLLLFDSKHKGRIDIVMVCPKRDGYPTYALYDTTGSGKASMIGYFRNHEFKPYKMEPYTG